MNTNDVTIISSVIAIYFHTLQKNTTHLSGTLRNALALGKVMSSCVNKSLFDLVPDQAIYGLTHHTKYNVYIVMWQGLFFTNNVIGVKSRLCPVWWRKNCKVKCECCSSSNTHKERYVCGHHEFAYRCAARTICFCIACLLVECPIFSSFLSFTLIHFVSLNPFLLL